MARLIIFELYICMRSNEIKLDCFSAHSKHFANWKYSQPFTQKPTLDALNGVTIQYLSDLGNTE